MLLHFRCQQLARALRARRLRKLLRIFIQHTPVAVRQREQDKLTDILQKLVRMCQQCIPGRFSPPLKRPGNGATFRTPRSRGRSLDSDL